jgi:hypothetical protein
MPEILLNTAGLSRTTGTADPVITSDTGKSGSFADVADGTEIAYYRRYAQAGRVGFENCIGIWHPDATGATIGYIDRTVTIKSSNDDAPVLWGVGLQVIDVSLSAEMVVSEDDRIRISALQTSVISAAYRKEIGDPIFIVGTGQSNMYGLTTIEDGIAEVNSRVFDWESTNAAPNTYAYAVADPYREFSQGLQTHPIGLGGDGYLSPLWAIADTIQKITGRDVYMYLVAKTSQTAGQWFAGQPMALSVANQIAPAMAAAGVTKVDGVFWLQGEADRSIGVAPIAYAESLPTIKAEAEDSGWSTPGYTPWVLIDIGDSWGKWAGIQKAVERLSLTGTVSYVNTNGLPDDGTHFTGIGYLELGIRAGIEWVTGLHQARPSAKGPQTDYLSFRTTNANTIDIYTGIGTVVATVTATNATNTKYYSAMIKYWYFGTGKSGATIVNDDGESGFSATVVDFGGFFGYFKIAGTAGETWHWSINMDIAPSLIWTPNDDLTP